MMSPWQVISVWVRSELKIIATKEWLYTKDTILWEGVEFYPSSRKKIVFLVLVTGLYPYGKENLGDIFWMRCYRMK